MRVLTVLTYYRPHWTGLTRYAQHIAEGLAERGHEVTVLASQHERDLPRREVLAGVTIVRVPSAGRLSRTALMPGFPLELRRQIAQHDVVHLHSPMPEAGLVVALARRAGVPSLVTHQGDVVMPPGAVNHVVQAAMAVTLGSAVRRADAVATHSTDYAEHSRLLAGRSGRVHGISPPTTIPPPDPAAAARWRAELGLEDRPVVGFAGRFVAEKGFDLLLRAVPAIRAAVPDVHLLFAGETDVVYEDTYERCRPLLEAHADAVSSVGLLLDRQRLADFYRLCDLFVLPSRTDCFAAVQLEALLSGTPVVATDIPGARMVVRETGMGRLVAPEDPAALAAGIIDELAHPRPRPRRDEVIAHYDASVAIDRYEAVLEGVVRGTPPEGGGTTAPAVGRPLDADARATLEAHLDREADMAYRRRLPRMVELLELDDGDIVLDAGCGRAAVANVIASVSGASLVALDPDRERLVEANEERVPAALVQGDVEHLPLCDGSVDKIICAEVLEHLDDDVAGASELARILRPGGVLVVSVPHAAYPAAWDPINKAREAAGLPHLTGTGPLAGHWAGHQRLYLPPQLRALLEGAGLVVEAIEEQTSRVFPLSHLLVYGIGKPLVEHGLLPERLRRSADRFRDPGEPPPRFDPVGIGVRALRRIDRRNDEPTGREDRFVTIVARAVKPGVA